MLREFRPASAYAELFQRYPENPILTARDWHYPAHTVDCTGACEVGGETVLLVRTAGSDAGGYMASRTAAAIRT